VQAQPLVDLGCPQALGDALVLFAAARQGWPTGVDWGGSLRRMIRRWLPSSSRSPWLSRCWPPAWPPTRSRDSGRAAQFRLLGLAQVLRVSVNAVVVALVLLFCFLVFYADSGT